MSVHGFWMNVGTATFRDTDVKTRDPSRPGSPAPGHSDSVIGIPAISQKESSLASPESGKRQTEIRTSFIIMNE